MSNNLKKWQQKIQDKRKQTPWRDFVKEIASWYSLSFYRWNSGIMTRFPQTDRAQSINKDKYEYNTKQETNTQTSSVNILSTLTQLFKDTQLPHIFWWQANENGDFADMWWYSKNIYLSFIYTNTENVAYSQTVKGWFDVYNSSCVRNQSHNIYQSISIALSSYIFYSSNIEWSSNIRFSQSCIWCTECIGCIWLNNKSYCIKNTQLTKKKYFEQKKLLLKQFRQTHQIPQKNINHNTDSFCEDVSNSYHSYNVKLWNNIVFSGWWTLKESFFDVISGWALRDFYWVFQGTYFSENIYCSAHINNSTHIFYSYLLRKCSYCFGCIGLKNKSYCIFNKEYTKEERHKKVDEIFTQMEADGDLGKFFPPKMNPFYFNDTAAALIEDFTKEEIIAYWYLRRDEEINVDIPEWMEVVTLDQLSEYEWYDDKWQWTINPSILKKVIKDKKGNAYRVIKMEYDFLVKHGLPLPRQHWLERLKGHFRVR